MHVLRRASVAHRLCPTQTRCRVTFFLYPPLFSRKHAEIVVGYSNARLATCFRCAPFALNANPLSRDFFLISATLFVQARRVADIRKHPL